ncbi:MULTISPECIES: ATP-grasp domain-containing protein [unclassified Amycolatopsis]|uniref:ATP-grasp domain-containing protein n=1 Tax=unclassified Amycolatopsis TaxID=2618356 RepID=UPI002875AFDB|nr:MULTISPECIES: ATP-grasp domain-containing protein [unclassified Amycolatopsis]MDS0139434.1 ATP-grasp domain-containing protein [Amycolatopsis sp. 505]MDS0147013.1 ATP-grasp domain-containing protein [Amycolatopsis sp. CM201R]
MRERPVLVVGFVTPVLLALTGAEPDGSVVLVEEPDVVRKRDLRARLAGSALVRDLVEWEHARPGSADEFHAAHPDLDPVAVIPLIEYATPFAARLAERYGLPGASLGAALILRDKAVLRRVSAAAGLANPESTTVTGPADVLEFMRACPGPVVLKPANRQASVGTQIVRDPAEAERAWANCVEQDEGIFVPDRPMDLRMLAERYVPGAEYSVEMLVRGGRQLFANVTGKQLYPGPYPVELAHIVPADIPGELTETLAEVTRRVVTATGFADGIVHCEWIVGADGVPYLVECAGRIAGDGIMEIIDRAYSIELLRVYFAVMRGETPPELPARATGGAAVRFVPMEPGVIEAVVGLEQARRVEGVFLVDLQVGPGHRFAGLRSSWDRSGLVMAQADSPAEALQRAEKAAGLVRIEVRPG